MSMEEIGPGRPSGAPGEIDQDELAQEAQHEQLVHETEEIHAEEAAEHGEAPQKPAWWMFWKR